MNNLTPAPFLIQGKVDGKPVSYPVSTVEAAEASAREITRIHAEAEVSWLIQPTSGGRADEHVVLAVRLQRGKVGESQRVMHLLRVRAGVLLPGKLIAVCTAELDRADLDFGVSMGMPCVRCLVTNPAAADPGELLDEAQ